MENVDSELESAQLAWEYEERRRAESAAEIDAERARKLYELEVMREALRASEVEALAGPIVRAVAAIEATVPDSRIRPLLQALKNLSPGHAARTFSVALTNLERREGHARRLQEAEHAAQALRAQTSRQGEHK